MNLFNNIYFSRLTYLIRDTTKPTIKSKEIPVLTSFLNQIIKGEHIAPSPNPTSLEKKVGLIQDNILSWKNALINELALCHLDFNVEEVIKEKLDELNSLQNDLKAHSGALWECVDRRESPFGGFIYRFIVKDESLDDFTLHPDALRREEEVEQKLSDIYPALELNPLRAADFFMMNKEEYCDRLEKIIALKRENSSLTDRSIFSLERDFDSQLKEARRAMDFEIARDAPPFSEVGYLVFFNDQGQLVMELPDREALVKGWENLQRKYPQKDLPDMNIVSAEGSVDDISFAQAYFKYDGLLSTGKEFIHDHSVHIYALIERMWKGRESYLKEKQRLRKSLEAPFQFVLKVKKMCEESRGLENTSTKLALSYMSNNLEKLKFLVGSLADAIFSYDNDDIDLLNPKWAEDYCSNPLHFAWDSYLKRRFGNGVDVQELSEVWRNAKAYIEYIETTKCEPIGEFQLFGPPLWESLTAGSTGDFPSEEIENSILDFPCFERSFESGNAGFSGSPKIPFSDDSPVGINAPLTNSDQTSKEGISQIVELFKDLKIKWESNQKNEAIISLMLFGNEGQKTFHDRKFIWENLVFLLELKENYQQALEILLPPGEIDNPKIASKRILWALEIEYQMERKGILGKGENGFEHHNYRCLENYFRGEDDRKLTSTEQNLAILLAKFAYWKGQIGDCKAHLDKLFRTAADTDIRFIINKLEQLAIDLGDSSILVDYAKELVKRKNPAGEDMNQCFISGVPLSFSSLLYDELSPDVSYSELKVRYQDALSQSGKGINPSKYLQYFCFLIRNGKIDEALEESSSLLPRAKLSCSKEGYKKLVLFHVKLLISFNLEGDAISIIDESISDNDKPTGFFIEKAFLHLNPLSRFYNLEKAKEIFMILKNQELADDNPEIHLIGYRIAFLEQKKTKSYENCLEFFMRNLSGVSRITSCGSPSNASKSERLSFLLNHLKNNSAAQAVLRVKEVRENRSLDDAYHVAKESLGELDAMALYQAFVHPTGLCIGNLSQMMGMLNPSQKICSLFEV